jgi:hypothetical protein
MYITECLTPITSSQRIQFNEVQELSHNDFVQKLNRIIYQIRSLIIFPQILLISLKKCKRLELEKV